MGWNEKTRYGLLTLYRDLIIRTVGLRDNETGGLPTRVRYGTDDVFIGYIAATKEPRNERNHPTHGGAAGYGKRARLPICMACEKVENRGLTAGVWPSQHREPRVELQIHRAKLLPLFEF